MRPLRAFLLTILSTAALSGCGQEKSEDFTLASGVTLTSTRSCEGESPPDFQPAPMRVTAVDNGYSVSVGAYLVCGRELAAEVSEHPGDLRTLMISQHAPKTPMQSGCECPGIIKAKIIDRLEKGQTLYVTLDKEALGHAVLP